MNRHILLLCLILSSVFSNAQDVIVLRNADEIQAKVKEITPTTISYVKWNNLDGPNYTINKSDVFFIKYENGEKEVFNSEPASKNHDLTETNKNTSSKIKFNPTPSSKYIVGLTFGYVSQQYIETYIEEDYGYGKKYKGKYSLMNINSIYTPTLEFGLDILPEFKYGIGIRTGLLLNLGIERGSSYYEGSYYYLSFGVNIPLHLSYRYEIVKDFSLFLRMGPTFNFNVGWVNTDDDSGIFEDKVFDCLWAITGGLRYKRFQLSIGGEFGMNSRGDSWDVVHFRKPVILSFTILLGKKIN